MQPPAGEDVRRYEGRAEEPPLQDRLHAHAAVVCEVDLLRVEQPLAVRVVEMLSVGVRGHEAPLARHLLEAGDELLPGLAQVRQLLRALEHARHGETADPVDSV